MDVDVDHPERDADWDREARGESGIERLDRNWADLLQELRVVQTGVQLLTGLLLTVPFQQRFTELGAAQRDVYLVTLSLSATATGLLIAPVAMHRLLFRRHARLSLVSAGQRYAIAGLAMLGLAVTGVIELIFGVVVGPTGAILAASCAFVLFAVLWGVVPWIRRARDDPGPLPDPDP